ncbi:MAG TPA: hypothetical protein VG498_14440 [Terriglobales bacterium]|nr:hypothetical protein [Terriglobales bacterium]
MKLRNPKHAATKRHPPDSNASFRNARFILLRHVPDHKMVVRHVHSGVTGVEVDTYVVNFSSIGLAAC